MNKYPGTQNRERVGKRKFSVSEVLKPQGFKERERVHPVERAATFWVISVVAAIIGMVIALIGR